MLHITSVNLQICLFTTLFTRLPSVFMHTEFNLTLHYHDYTEQINKPYQLFQPQSCQQCMLQKEYSKECLCMTYGK